jgi:hypothetical protein
MLKQANNVAVLRDTTTSAVSLRLSKSASMRGIRASLPFVSLSAPLFGHAPARLMGACEFAVPRTVVIPSTLAWVFDSLVPAVSFALVGVIR